MWIHPFNDINIILPNKVIYNVPYAKSISRNLIYIYTSSKPCESIYPRQLYILESGTEQMIQNDII